MARIQERGESYRILFRYHGKQHTAILGEVSEKNAHGGDRHPHLRKAWSHPCMSPPPESCVQGKPRPNPTKLVVSDFDLHSKMRSETCMVSTERHRSRSGTRIQA